MKAGSGVKIGARRGAKAGRKESRAAGKIGAGPSGYLSVAPFPIHSRRICSSTAPPCSSGRPPRLPAPHLQSLMEKRDALRKMVVDPKWDEIPDVKTRKGKDATATMLSVPFWKSVALCLKVFEPLVRLLRLVDGDVRPAMAFLYGELIKAKKEIKEAFGNVENNYKDVMAIVDKKMKGRLDSSLHVAAYLLNPYYSYRDAAIFDDSSVVEKFMLCCETFFEGDEEKEYLAVNEDFDKFRTKQGSFGKKMARSCERFEFNPGIILFISAAILLLHSTLTNLIRFILTVSILVEALWRWSTKFATHGFSNPLIDSKLLRM